MNNVQALSLTEVARSTDRRAAQREALVTCAETTIAERGLAGLRARDLAACVGCATGAIYNLVRDLDELALLVAQRTMADLNARLEAVQFEPGRGRARAEHRLVAWALAYRAFAAANRNRWRALFEHRLPADRELPDWFAADQMRLFIRIEETLAVLLPSLDAPARRLRARTLFSAVHGIVALGLEEKLVAMPPAALDDELRVFVRSYVTGLVAADPQPV